MRLNITELAYLVGTRAEIEICPGCGRFFSPESGKQKYCTTSCASTKESQIRRKGLALSLAFFCHRVPLWLLRELEQYVQVQQVGAGCLNSTLYGVRPICVSFFCFRLVCYGQNS